MRASLAALATLLATTTASPNPNGWSTTKTVPDGPTKLDDCGCGPIYKTMLKCQTLPMTPDGDAIHECVCVPNPDGWYGYLDSCRDCLFGDDFFENYAKMITQLLVSCTQAGGNVWSTGDSICATNAYTHDCVSLGTDGRASWASIDSTMSESGNATYVLDIKGSGSGSGSGSSKSSSASESKTSTASKGSASSSSSGAASKTTGAGSATTTGTATGAATTETGSATEGSQGTQTSTGPESATTSPSAGSRTQAGIVGLVLAVGAVVLM